MTLPALRILASFTSGLAAGGLYAAVMFHADWKAVIPTKNTSRYVKTESVFVKPTEFDIRFAEAVQK